MATCPSCRSRYPDGEEVCDLDGQRLLPDAAFGSADHDLPSGFTVGEYTIEKKLGEGGFGSVYRAVHPLIGKTVAIKVLNRQYSSNPQMVSRFIAEARAVNQIRQRNIIDIFSFGALDDGRHYYVMELLEGMTLDEFIRSKGRLSVEVAIPILRSVARALDAAHAAGIAHRDLKPENVFLVADEDGGIFPKLLDFGIAKLLVDTKGGHKTRTGAPMGTPRYMSPEQCRGRNVDHRTDVYSFGILTHEALTGRAPFEGEDVMDLLVKQTSSPAPPVSSVCKDLSREIDAPILHMLEKEPTARPASCGAAIEALTAAAKRAGHAVSGPQVVVPAASPSGPGVRSGPNGNLTPSELGLLSEAPTLAQGVANSKTLLGSESDVGSVSRASAAPRKRGALIAIAVCAISLGVAGVLLSRTWATPTQAATGPGNATTPQSNEPAKATEPSIETNTPKVTPMTDVPPPIPAEIEVEIQSAPDTAVVFADDVRLGPPPGPFRFKRGTEKIKLTIKAEGFKNRDVLITTEKSVIIPAEMTKSGPSKQPTTKKQPGANDLPDNPY
jgi:eukaryotic-like serine/threonine-protein kinase